MSIVSPVRITWQRNSSASVELVAVGELLAAPMVTSGRQDVLEVASMGANEEFFRALGGALLTIDLHLEHDLADLDTSLVRLLDMQTTWIGQAGHVGTLTVEAEDVSWYATFTPCVLGELVPELPTDTGAATIRRRLRFTSAPPTYTEP